MSRSAWLLSVSAGLLLLGICALPVPLPASQNASVLATVKDIDGHSFRLFGPDAKATVLFFVTDDCPITDSYMPEINRIVANYSPQKVAFFAVYPDPSVPVSGIRKHARAFDLQIPLISDKAHLLVRRAGASVTPEAVVFTPGGQLVYRGRIDNWYVDFGKRRIAPTQRYLRQALDEILKGQPVAIDQVPPLGCAIAP